MPEKVHKRVRFAREKIEYPVPANPPHPRTSSSLPSSDGPRTPPSPHRALPGYSGSYSYYPPPPPKPVMQPPRAHNLIGYSHKPALNFDITLPTSMLTSRYQSLSSALLAEPAVTPPAPILTLTTHYLPWSITIYPSNGYYVTVRDMLDAIYHALRNNVTHQEYQSRRGDQLRINEAYQRRYSRIRDSHMSREEKKNGVKRVDFLCGRTRFMGISSTSRPDVWELRLDYH